MLCLGAAVTDHAPPGPARIATISIERFVTEATRNIIHGDKSDEAIAAEMTKLMMCLEKREDAMELAKVPRG